MHVGIGHLVVIKKTCCQIPDIVTMSFVPKIYPGKYLKYSKYVTGMCSSQALEAILVAMCAFYHMIHCNYFLAALTTGTC